MNILTDLFESRFTDPILTSFALKISDFLGCNSWDKCTNTSGLWLTNFSWNFLTGLSGEKLTILLRSLDAVKFGNFLAFLLWEAATLLFWSLRTYCVRNWRAFLLVDSVALFLGRISANFLSYVFTFLSSN